MSTARTPQVSIFGNLSSDPQRKTLPAKTVTREVYDFLTNDVVERTFATPERTFLVFSLGVNGKDGEGEPITHWIRCVDWHRKAEAYRAGDRVWVNGFFKTRSYVKDGETRTIREFVVVETRLERQKVREEAEVAA